MESSFQLMIAYDMIYYVKFTALSINPLRTTSRLHQMVRYPTIIK